MSENDSAVDHSPWSRQGARHSEPAALAATAPATPPTGWYPDPADAERQRFWDGTNWTAETRPIAPPPSEFRLKEGVPVTGAPGEPVADPYAAVGPAWGSGYLGAAAATPAPPVAAPPYAGALGPRTADGVPLAGWWWRVLAIVVDNVLLGLLSQILLMATVFSDITPAINAWSQEMMEAAYRGGTDITLPIDLAVRYGQLTLAQGGIYALYMMLMWVWRGATVGQLVCTLRVVPNGHGLHKGGLPLGKALMRTLVWAGLSTLGVGAFMVLLPGHATQILFAWVLVVLVVALWPLFNAKRQGLHDLAGGTQVVRLG